MKYLCLIHLDEQKLAAMPAADMSALNLRHWEYNEQLRASGSFIVAEALEPASTSRTIRVRDGKTTVTDGPYAEAKEMIAGFYLIEAPNLQAATEIAAKLPSAPLGTIEVRPARQLHVDGLEPRWG